MKHKLIIFDLDGTILDTLADLKNSLNAALLANRLPERTLAEVRGFVGNGIGTLIARGVPEGTPDAVTEEVLACFRAHYQAHATDDTRPYDGVSALMKEIRRMGGQIAVVSNKADSAVQDLCGYYFPGLIDAAQGEREGIRRKPAPDAVLETMRRFDVTADETLYIGDSEVDIQTARNACVASVAVTWGFRDREFLLEQGAGALADSPEEILPYL